MVGGVMTGEVCMAGGMCGGGGHAWQECAWQGHAWQGCAWQGGVWQGCAWQGVCVAGGHAWLGGMRGRRDGHCSRRYASSWNTFLFNEVYTL